MSLRLTLGVVDVAYAHTPPEIRTAKASLKKARKAPKTNAPPENITTGDVATLLEKKYHPMEIFAEIHQADIAKDLEESLAGALENILVGAPVDMKPFDAATSSIEDRFR